MKKEIRIQVWEKYNNKCAYCGTFIDFKKMQIDHIFPKIKGGIDNITNYNPSCRQCNFYKRTFLIEEFRMNMKSLHERLLKIFLVKIALKYGIIEFKKPFCGLFYFEKKQENEK